MDPETTALGRAGNHWAAGIRVESGGEDAGSRESKFSPQALFEELNNKYFRGRLRRCSVRLVNFSIPGKEGGYDSSSKTIFLRRHLNQRKMRETLLHETCHVGCPSHGARFKARLVRLSELGAKLNVADRNLMKDTDDPRSLTREIKNALDELALEQPHIDWPAARRLLADYFGRSPSQLERAAPWARKLWTTPRNSW
jgi:hypothetical protein